MISDFISNLFGWLSNWLGFKPFTAFMLAAAGAIVAFLTSDDWWSLHLLFVSIACAIAILGESIVNPIKGFIFSLSLFHIPMGIDEIGKAITGTPYECGFTSRTLDQSADCAKRTTNSLIQKYAPQAPRIP